VNECGFFSFVRWEDQYGGGVRIRECGQMEMDVLLFGWHDGLTGSGLGIDIDAHSIVELPYF